MSARRFGWAALFALAWRQRQGAPGRTALAVAGLLLAALGFALAGGVTASATLVARHTLARRDAVAYDLLVRPSDAVSPAERRLHLVAPDELRWGAGITLAQWRAIARLPGVAVAAPVAPAGILELAAPTAAHRRLLIPVVGIDPVAEDQLAHLRQALAQGALFPAVEGARDWLTPPFLLVTRGAPPAGLPREINGVGGALGGGLLPAPVDRYVMSGGARGEVPVLERRAAPLPALPRTATAWLSIGRPAGSLSGVVDAARLPLGDSATTLPFALYGRGPMDVLPLLLTDVRAVCRLLGDGCISALRVRVNAPAGANRRRAAIVAQVAESIQRRTGLWVDVTYGSAGRPVHVVAQGWSATEVWTALGATLAIVRGVNAANLLLFALVCAVALLYTVVSSFVAALLRGGEHRILRHNGWPEWAIRRLTLADTLLISSGAGALAVLALLAIVLVFNLTLPPAAPWAVLPLSMALYALGAALGTGIARWEQRSPHPPPQYGLAPRFVRDSPVQPASPSGGAGAYGVAAHAPLARAQGGETHPMGPGVKASRFPWWLGVALRNQRRRPLRTALAVLTSAVAAALFTVLLLGAIALHGLLALTLLGEGVAVELAPYHAVLAMIAVALAATAAADVAVQGLRERRPEIGVLRAVGCSRWTVLRLVAIEAGLAGLAGSLLGVAVAVPLAAWGYGDALAGASLPLAVAAALGGAIAFSLAGALPPALLAIRITPAEALRHD